MAADGTPDKQGAWALQCSDNSSHMGHGAAALGAQLLSLQPLQCTLAPPPVGATHSTTAVCIVGQLRTLDQTAASLRAFLLDELDAEGFVVLATTGDIMSSDERTAVRALGPRIVSSRVGPEHAILNLTLVAQLARARAHADYELEMREPATGWPRRLAAFLVHLKTCYDDVRAREASRGVPYDVYVRARPDIQLFTPLPASFIAQLARPGFGNQDGFGSSMAMAPAGDRDARGAVAVLPAGEDYGGLNDRFFVGDGAAFAADAGRWHSLYDDRPPPTLPSPWNCEKYFAAILRVSHVTVRRAPLSYCLVTESGACKYPGELSHALEALPTLLEEKAALCGIRQASHSCNPLRPLPAEQSPDMVASDPGFCRLEARCRRARQDAPPVCLADDSVAVAGERLAATIRCEWPRDAEIGNTATPGSGGDMTAISAGRRLESRSVDNASLAVMQAPRRAQLRASNAAVDTSSSVELVVARHEEDLSWLHEVEDELPNVRIFVYDKSANRSCAAYDLKTATCISVPNVGLEAFAYLHHITTHYDRLADKTVFVHNKPTPGFFGHRKGGGHMMPHDDFLYDYLRPAAPPRYVPTFVRGGVMGNGSLMSFRLALSDPLHGGPESLAYADSANGPTAMCPASAALWSRPFSSSWDVDYLKKDVIDPHGDVDFTSYWSAHLEAAIGPPPEPHIYAQGCVMSVGSAQITAHPRSFYEGLLRTTSGHVEEASAYYLELAWGRIFGFDVNQCIDTLPIGLSEQSDARVALARRAAAARKDERDSHAGSMQRRLSIVPVASTVRMSSDDCPTAATMRGVVNGTIAKGQLELVVARFEEDVGWSDPFARVRSIYDKSGAHAVSQLTICPIAMLTGPAFECLCHAAVALAGSTTLRNVGLEQHTYLTHIVRHYDALAERTVFMHGRAPSCGFFLASGERGGHLLANVSASDYLTHPLFDSYTHPAAAAPAVFMPITARLDRALSKQSLRSAFADRDPDDPSGQSTVLRPVAPFPTGDAGDRWLPWERWNLRGTIENVAIHTDEPRYTLDSFFHAVFGRPPPQVLYLAQGAQFAASADALRHMPKPTYEWLLQEMEHGHNELIYLMEISWWYLLGGRFDDGGQTSEVAAASLGDDRNGEPLDTFAHLGPPARRALQSSYGYGYARPPAQPPPPALPPSSPPSPPSPPTTPPPPSPPPSPTFPPAAPEWGVTQAGERREPPVAEGMAGEVRALGHPSCMNHTGASTGCVTVPRITTRDAIPVINSSAAFRPPQCDGVVAGCLRLPTSTRVANPIGMSEVGNNVAFSTMSTTGWDSAANSAANSMGWADADGDGLLDLAICGSAIEDGASAGGYVQVIRNLGNGMWSTTRYIISSSTNVHRMSVAWLDVDNDGHVRPPVSTRRPLGPRCSACLRDSPIGWWIESLCRSLTSSRASVWAQVVPQVIPLPRRWSCGMTEPVTFSSSMRALSPPT